MSFPDEETLIWAKKKFGGGGIPELTIKIQHVSNEQPFLLTEEESAALEAVSENKLLCVVFDATSVGYGRYTALMGRVWPSPDMPDMVAFQGSDHQMYFYGLMNIEGTWFGSCVFLDQMS